MRWRWLRRVTMAPKDDQLRERLAAAQRRLDDTESAQDAVDQRASTLEQIARRNSFAPMLRRALGGGHR